jgi:RNA polymerase sigma-70 factor (ECF subfamily)
VHRIAIHAALRLRRKERRRRAVPWASHEAPTAGAIEANDDAERLRRAMDGLSEDHRVVLALLALRDVPGRVIADVLGIAEGTVHSRAHAARAKLREALEDGERGTREG